MAEQQMVKEIAEVICQAVNLGHLNTSEMVSDTALMDGGMGLDSVDVLEAVLAIEHHFDIKIENAEEGKKHFHTLGTIADFVQSKKQ